MKQIKVIDCTCEHEYQDNKYGKNKRVHNYGLTCYMKTEGWRCTVCSDTKPE